jgi:transposase
MGYEGGIFMTKKGAVGFEVMTEYMAGKMRRTDAALMLDVTERSVTRMASRVRVKGLLGMVHGNRGRRPAIKTPDITKAKALKLMKQKYCDFNMTHALEMLTENEGLDIAYTTFRRWCHEKGFVKRAKRTRRRARERRDRVPCEGLLLQMDGSEHPWNGRVKWSLIAAIDDATSEIPHAEFFESEDTPSTMTVMRRIVEKKGIPFALYVDRAGCFGGGKRAYFAQFKRACGELGIRILFASSPEAKGRIERTFNTFQDRIVPELALYDIRRRDKANEYLWKKFLPNYWERRCRVAPRDPQSKYRPLPKGTNLSEIFCLKYRRTVNNDNTVQWRKKVYQLAWPDKRCRRGHKIEFRVYPDRSWKAFHANDPVELKPALMPIRATLQAKKPGETKSLAI